MPYSPDVIRTYAESAADHCADQEKKLFRSDGTKFYSDQEHADRLRELRKVRNARLDELGQEAMEAHHAAEAEVSHLKNRDLSGLLSGDELAAANNRYQFISEEVLEMNSTDLSARVDSVLAAGDRASAFCHARAIRKRASGSERPATGLTEAAKRLEDYIHGASRDSGIESAEARAKDYLDSVMLCNNLKQGSRTAAGAWEARLAGRR